MAMPDMIPVDSTNIARVGYESRRHELFVEFHSGRTYVYSPVSDAVYREFLSAGSMGSYLNERIKPNYDCRPI